MYNNEDKFVSMQEVLESGFDMVEEVEVRENLGWALITDTWVLITH